MGFFDDLGHAFESAGNAIKDVAEKASDAIKTGAGEVADTAKTVATPIAVGTLTFAQGMRDLCRGDLDAAAHEMAFGLADAAGVPVKHGGPLDVRWDQIVTDSLDWSYRTFSQRNRKVCFTAYRDHVREEYRKQSLDFTDASEQSLRGGAQYMGWIDMGC